MSDDNTQDAAEPSLASVGSAIGVKDAVERGIQLATTPMKDVPLLAREFLWHLAKKVGMCGEVCITAFAVYAQCVEGLPCDDDLYLARPEDIEWFSGKS
jgi:hypothetical protein